MHMGNALQQVIIEYSKIPNIESILLFGSRATPFFDGSSDYDLYVVFSGKKPTKSTRSRFARIPAVTDFKFQPDEDTWHNEWILPGEAFSMHQIKVDVGYQSIDFLQSVVVGVARDGRISLDIMKFRPYTILGLLEDSELLYDKNNRIQTLRKLIRPFPLKLKKALIKEGREIVSESLDDLTDYCARSVGNNAFIFHLWRISGAICQMVFALNEKYDPSTKRVEKYFPNLKIKPRDFEKRFDNILEGPFNQRGRRRTVREIRSLFHDVTLLTSFHESGLRN